MFDNSELLQLEPNKEITIFRAALSTNNLRKLAESPTEIGIIVYKDIAKILKSDSTEGIQYIPEINTKPLFQIHSHPEHGGDQPSIVDLNSAELWQLYNDNPDVRFLIITVRGVTEYRIPDRLTSVLQNSGDEFREYYLDWLKRTFGEEEPDGQTISTAFNEEHNTFTFHPWESPGANKIVQELIGL